MPPLGLIAPSSQPLEDLVVLEIGRGRTFSPVLPHWSGYPDSFGWLYYFNTID